MDKLLQRIKLQASGEAEAPPITLPDWLDEDDLAGDDEDDTVEVSAAGATKHRACRETLPGTDACARAARCLYCACCADSGGLERSLCAVLRKCGLRLFMKEVELCRRPGRRCG